MRILRRRNGPRRRGRRRFAAWLFLLAWSLPLPSRAQEPVASTDDPMMTPIEKEPPGARGALVVGVDHYRHLKGYSLRCAVNDAQEFQSFLTKEWGFQSDRSVLLTDKATDESFMPTKGTLDVQIQMFLDKNRRDKSNTALFLFAGHGWRDEKGEDWFVPPDGHPSVPDSCYSADRLIKALEERGPRRAVVFLDACRNLPPRTEGDRAAVLVGLQPRDTKETTRGLAVIYACRAGQVSREDLTLTSGTDRSPGHGVFTYFLLKGLRGEAAREDGLITLKSLFQFLKEKVPQQVRDQEPYLWASDGEMVLRRAHPPLTPKPAIEDLLRAAFVDLRERNYPKAIEKAERVLKDDRDNKRAYYVLGIAYLRQKRCDDAIRQFNRALEIDKDYLEAGEQRDVAKQECASRRASTAPAEPNSRALATWIFPVPREGAVLASLPVSPMQCLLAGISLNLPPVPTEAALLRLLAEPAEADDAWRLAREARQLWTESRFAEADARANEALAHDPDNALAHLVLGHAALREARYDVALREYQEAQRLDASLLAAREGMRRVLERKGPADTWSLASEAIALLDVERVSEAEAKAREAIARYADNARAHLALGRVYHARKRYDDALHEYDEAIRLDPTLTDVAAAVEATEQAKRNSRLVPMVREAYERVLAGQYEEARAPAAEVLRQMPENATARFVMGRIAHHEKQYGLAIREYQEALWQEPSLEAARQGLRDLLMEQPAADPAQLVADARRRIGQGDIDGAEPLVREAIARMPEDAPAPPQGPAHLALGRVYERQGHLEEAIREYRTASRLDPQNPDPVASLRAATAAQGKQEAERLAAEGYRHLSRTEFLAARDKARRAIELDSENTTAHAVLGNALLWLDDVAAGEQAIQEALRRDGKLPLAYLGRGNDFYLRGRALHFQSDQQQMTAKQHPPKSLAARQLEREAERSWREARKWYEQAEKEFKKARDLRENDTQNDILAHNNLGAVYQALERFEDAVAEYQKALKLDQYYVTFYNLGNAYLEIGRREEDRRHAGRAAEMWGKAEKAFRQAILLYPQASGRLGQLESSGSLAQLAATRLKQGEVQDALFWARRARKQGLVVHPVFDQLANQGFGIED